MKLFKNFTRRYVNILMDDAYTYWVGRKVWYISAATWSHGPVLRQFICTGMSLTKVKGEKDRLTLLSGKYGMRECEREQAYTNAQEASEALLVELEEFDKEER